MHNDQFNPGSHVTVALDAARELPASSSLPFELPDFELPDFSSLFGGGK